MIALINDYCKRYSRKLFVLALVILSPAFLSCEKELPPLPEGYISLFDGYNLWGWIPKFAGHPLGENYKKTFHVKDGLLKVSYDEWEKFDGEFGHLFYKDRFSSYRLLVEYRFVGEQVEGGPKWAYRNNGIMIHCQDPKTMTLEQGFPVSLEVQLLGGNGKDERHTGNLCTPGTNVHINGELVLDHCIESSSPTYHGDQWVTAEVEVHSDSLIRHYINGELVFEYEKPQLDERDEDAQKLIRDGNLTVKEGYIAIQAETAPTEFRRIAIKPLDK